MRASTLLGSRVALFLADLFMFIVAICRTPTDR